MEFDKNSYRVSSGSREDEDVQGCIAVAVDDSAESDAALKWCTLNMITSKDTVSLFTIYPEPEELGGDTPTIRKQEENKAVQLLLSHASSAQSLADDLDQMHVHAVSSGCFTGEAIRKFIGRRNPAFLAVGARKRGNVERMVAGSVSDYCVHHATCPVLVIPEASHNIGANIERMKVVISVDPSLASMQALEWFASQEFLSQTQITVVHVVCKGSTSKDGLRNVQTMTDTVDRVLKDRELEYRLVLLGTGKPAKTLMKFVNDSHTDLLLMGARGLGAMKRMVLGSTSDYCLHHVSCPTMIFKSGEGPSTEDPEAYCQLQDL